MNLLRLRYFIFLFGLFGVVIACDDDDTFSITPAIGFGAITGEISESSEAGKSVTFYTNTTVTEPITLTIKVTNVGEVAYGTDYTTLPAPVDNVITFTINPDEENPSFWVYPVEREGSPAVRKVNFEITAIAGGNVSLTETQARYYQLQITKNTELVHAAFEDCNGDPVDFTEQIATGAMTASTWGCTNFGYSPVSDTEYTIGVEANAFGKGTGTSNAYLVSPAVEGGDYSSLVVSLMVYSRYTGSGNISIKYSSNYSGTGDPEASGVTWTELTSANAGLPAAGSQIWNKVTGTIDNAGGKTFYIAVQYIGGTTASASNWRIDNFIVTALN